LAGSSTGGVLSKNFLYLWFNEFIYGLVECDHSRVIMKGGYIILAPNAGLLVQFRITSCGICFPHIVSRSGFTKKFLGFALLLTVPLFPPAHLSPAPES
jgi:hypothetical protein